MTSKKVLNFLLKSLLCLALLLLKTTSFAIASDPPAGFYAGTIQCQHDDCPGAHADEKNLDSVILVTPYFHDTNPDFEGALQVSAIDGRAVCLPPEEYKRIRAVDLAKDDIAKVCAAPQMHDSLFVPVVEAIAIGFVTGYLLRAYQVR